jgi:hypothetical protein
MATPSSPGLTIDQLQRFIDRLERVEPNDKDQYVYGGKTYTKAAWKKFVNKYKTQLNDIKRETGLAAEGGAYIFSSAGQSGLRRDAEIARIDEMGRETWLFVERLKKEANRSLSVQEQNNLRDWISFYEKEMARLEVYANYLSSGGPIKTIKDIELVSLGEAKKPISGAAAEPSAPATPAAPSSQQPPATSVDISNITSKEQARTEIARLRQRSNTLKGLIGETKNGVTLYYEVPGSAGMSKGQRDAIVANIEAKIAALSTKWFAETPAAPAAAVPAADAPTTPSASQPFVPNEGQGIFGQPVADTNQGGGSALTGGLVPVVIPDTFSTPSSDIPVDTTSDVVSDTTPEVVSDTTPEVVSDTAPIATPTAPSFTDPATGVTYQPGEMIGGEDRALPNGGGVVNGIYIPPGIDYAWLGQQVPEDWESAAKELYGAYYEMIKQNQELGSLIKNAIQQGWSDDKFQYELEQTNWWKTTSANTRNWETLLIQDPASAQVQLDNRTALLRDTAQRLGITLTSESLARIAEDSIKLGLELTSQLEDIVGSEALRSVGTVSQLRYGYVGNSIRESARKYGVSLSDTTFNEWVNKIAVGAESQETFESYAQQIARTLYPSLNNGFDRGLSFAQMTDPYAQVASRILEIPGAQVDFTNPKWAQAFTMKDDKGNPMQMSFGEWADYLRTDPSFGWEYTDDAKNRAYTVVNRLAELFGAA